MPSYAYRAYTEAGQRRDGRIDAEGTSAAEQALWLEGLKIVALNPVPPKKTMADYFPSLYQISRADSILFTRQLALVIGAVVVAVAGGIILALRTARGVYAKDQLSIKAPILGPIVLSAVLNRFARTLAMVLKAGVPLGQTFEAVIASTGNKVFQKGLATVKEQMTSGEGFAGPLIRPRLFPPMLTQMVRLGEETG